MAATNSWLCQYALAQVGRPYWYATNGQIATSSVYNNITVPAIDREGYSHYTNWQSQLGSKVHDCSGLIVGAAICDDVNGAPVRGQPSGVPHYTVSMYNLCFQAGTIKPISQFDNVPGRILFPNNSNPGHVGVYVGDGYTVDCRSHSQGTIKEQLGTGYNWKYFGQLPYFQVDTSSTTQINVPVDTPNQPTTGVSVVGAYETVNVVNIGGVVYAQNFRPFIATILPGGTKVDYKRLVDLRVSGVMFNAGSLYDNSLNGHSRKSSYKNPELKYHVEACTQCNLPYALYAISRAKNRIEADAECKELYYVLAQFPPRLGVWLYPDMHNQKAVNEEIIDVYYNYFVKWGLKDRCGIYTDKSRMTQFDWSKYVYKFYLWLEDNMSPGDLDSVDDLLLRPSMFEVP